MDHTLKIKNVVIGEGMPKICVPMVGTTLTELTEEAEQLLTLDLDIVEWRVDFFESVEDIEKVKEALIQIKEKLKGIPLIFTFRSAEEGGERKVAQDFYVALNKAIIETGNIDIVDVELFNDENDVKMLIDLAHRNQVYVILSNHDFEKTPPKEELVKRLRKAIELGGDIPKIAVMPKDAHDVLRLLEATLEISSRPIVTMAMAGQGVISRLTGEVFGSCITFAAANKPSAPGQIGVAELRNVLQVIHENVNRK
ncbi:type I 3-dehydroquinate dehydratase [Oceanobacillus arenosus]|uniref:3-dehydroquinate dehydratase n=1 Tax=Oceanobacillus arenosus TaxID=1229153 RepID=A0A3D8PSS3_9BACI|nr:type I 3-dehydroquinate dehydratase [Oceanobacillus arenosus]RDW19014.1 type I 3-dehydroquinate dehydratase [Oceanobacillus arenosus]